MLHLLILALERAIRERFARYVVTVGRSRHYAYTFRDALAWARCYPASFGLVRITERRTGKTLCLRVAKEG